MGRHRVQRRKPENIITLVTDQTIAKQVGITTINTKVGSVYWGDGDVEVLINNIEKLHDYIAGQSYQIRLDEAKTISRLVCDNSNITNISNLDILESLNSIIISNNPISGDLIINSSVLSSIITFSCPNLTSIVIPNASSLITVTSGDNIISSFDTNLHINLVIFRFVNCNFSTIDLSLNTKLTSVWLYGNSLINGIDFSTNSLLINVQVFTNSMTAAGSNLTLSSLITSSQQMQEY